MGQDLKTESALGWMTLRTGQVPGQVSSGGYVVSPDFEGLADIRNTHNSLVGLM